MVGEREIRRICREERRFSFFQAKRREMEQESLVRRISEKRGKVAEDLTKHLELVV
uniref:Uncharacterized protein n=1 Tax=Nelumbo nucifera TaxID=4432 RepID=A0A822ZN76_NELNU|nr:TPA_asm: hypothetical protein HUJ06_004577 [Nelumbo nucifera]